MVPQAEMSTIAECSSILLAATSQRHHSKDWAKTLRRLVSRDRRLGLCRLARSQLCSVSSALWYFSVQFLQMHEADSSSRCISDRQKTVSPGETVKVPVKMQQTYVPFEQALQHSFKSMRPREMKRTPDSLWGILCELARALSVVELY